MEHLGQRLAKATNALSIPLGFRYIAKRNKFIRKTEYGFDAFFWTLHPTISNNITGQKYSLVVELRHDIVENVVNQLGLIHGAENQKQSSTVCSPLELFPPSNSRQYSYFLSDSALDSDVAKVAQSIHDVVEEDALTFFKRYSSVYECATDLNSLFRSHSHFLFNNLERRMYYAITTAKLASLPDFNGIYKQWSSTCDELLPEKIRSGSHKKLTRLLEILENSRV